MSKDEARNLLRVMTDLDFTSVYMPFLLKLYEVNEKTILKHDPDKEGIHTEGVLKGMNLQILRETKDIRARIDQFLTSP